VSEGGAECEARAVGRCIRCDETRQQPLNRGGRNSVGIGSGRGETDDAREIGEGRKRRLGGVVDRHQYDMCAVVMQRVGVRERARSHHLGAPCGGQLVKCWDRPALGDMHQRRQHA